jgi:hypothetical protein
MAPFPGGYGRAGRTYAGSRMPVIPMKQRTHGERGGASICMVKSVVAMVAKLSQGGKIQLRP